MASRSLGTLTLDLVARTGGFVQGMDKAQRESAKWRRQAQKDMQQIGRAVGVATAAVVAGVGALVVQSIRAADQSRKTAQAIGLTTEAYTGLAFAASQSGLSNQDLANSMGRLSRSASDAASGLETYAEVYRDLGIVVTDANGDLRSGEDILMDMADAFAGMPDGARKTATAMELLGRSGAKMIPLLNQGSEGIRALTEQARALGLVVSDRTAQQAELFNDSLAVMGALSKGLGNQIAEQLLPTMSDLASGMATVATEGNLTQGVADTLSFSIRGLAASAVGAYAAFQLAGKSIGGLYAIVNAGGENMSWVDKLSPGGALKAIAKNWSAVSDQAGIVVEDLEAEVEKYAGLLDQIMGRNQEPGETNAATEHVKELAAALEAAREAARLAAEEQRKADEALRKQEGIAKQIEALKLQGELLGKSAREQALIKLAADGAGTEQLELADSILATVEAYEKQIKKQKEAEAAMSEQSSAVKAIEDSLRTQEEMIERSYQQRRDTILAYEKATGEDQTKLLMRLHEERNEQLGDLNQGYWETYLESAQTAMESMDEMVGETLNRFAGGMGDAFEAMIFDAQTLEESMQSLAESMLRSVVNALGQMAAQWLAYQAVQMITARTSEAASSAAATATGTAIASAYAPAAAMASLATMGANSAPAMAGIAATTALAQSMSLMGMAHDGIDSVPQDGTWLLQKGERVTTAETSAKLDGVLDRIASGQGMGRGGSSVSQTINVTGNVDRRTAEQIATSTARKQRQATHRLGS